MNRLSARKMLLIAFIFLILSVLVAIVSIFPVYPGGTQSHVMINDTFTLNPNEIYRQGLGSFLGGENISLQIQSPVAFQKNFSLDFPNSTYLLVNSDSGYSVSTKANISYSFIANADYYDAVFTSSSQSSGIIHFQVSVQQPKAVFTYSWLSQTSKIMFIVSLSAIFLLTLKITLSNSNYFKLNESSSQIISKKNCQRLIMLLFLSLIIWLSILAVNTNPLATFENWYTDNGRDTYVSSLFLKDGFSIFSQPLGKLASVDTTSHNFVTWPQMPHLYPLGSILLFLPFGVLLQNGFNSSLIYKVEIAIFLVFATVCIYYFLRILFKKDMALLLKLIGVYIIYVTLIVFAADGMFDSIAFLFSLFAISMFFAERYDYCFLLVMVSTFLKYQAGIFLFPLIIFSLIKFFQANNYNGLLRSKAVIIGFVFGLVSIFTASLSAPYLIATGPQLIMNGINAFSPNVHIGWLTQSASILATLVVIIAYSLYMLNKNGLLSVSAIFLLLPSFMLPYFQDWYIPFIFLYTLIPQRKRELEVTMLWIFFMILVLAFSGGNYYPFIGYLNPHLPSPLKVG
jgi:hypothetical protein